MAKATQEELDEAVKACLEPKSDRDLVVKLNRALRVAKRLPKPPKPDTPLNIAARKRLEAMRAGRRSW